MAKPRKMGGHTQEGRWQSSGRWVAILKKVGGKVQGDGWPYSGGWVAKHREMGTSIMHVYYFDHSDCTEHDKWQCRLSFIASPSTFSKCSCHKLNGNICSEV